MQGSWGKLERQWNWGGKAGGPACMQSEAEATKPSIWCAVAEWNTIPKAASNPTDSHEMPYEWEVIKRQSQSTQWATEPLWEESSQSRDWSASVTQQQIARDSAECCRVEKNVGNTARRELCVWGGMYITSPKSTTESHSHCCCLHPLCWLGRPWYQRVTGWAQKS